MLISNWINEEKQLMYEDGPFQKLYIKALSKGCH